MVNQNQASSEPRPRLREARHAGSVGDTSRVARSAPFTGTPGPISSPSWNAKGKAVVLCVREACVIPSFRCASSRSVGVPSKARHQAGGADSPFRPRLSHDRGNTYDLLQRLEIEPSHSRPRVSDERAAWPRATIRSPRLSSRPSNTRRVSQTTSADPRMHTIIPAASSCGTTTSTITPRSDTSRQLRSISAPRIVSAEPAHTAACKDFRTNWPNRVRSLPFAP